jgi:hypothetical protein
MGTQHVPQASGWGCRGFLLLLVLTVVGCHGRFTGTVTGRVTFKGQPVTSGQVTLLGVDGRRAFGRITREGTYVVYGAPLGRVTILVESKSRSNLVASGPAAGATNSDPPRANESETAGLLLPLEQAEPIPEHYSRADASALFCMVRRGDQTYDIVLVP